MMLASWIAAGVVIFVFPKPIVVIAVCLVATASTALWVAHIVRASSRNTLVGTLRQFGASRQDAKAIVAVFDAQAGAGSRGSSLKEGETLRIQFAPGASGTGQRLSRITIVNAEQVIGAVILSSGGTYVPLDPHDVAPESIR